MVLRTWGKALLAALCVAAAAGAGQLGVAYGLGIVRLDRNFLGNTAHEWPAQLAWVAWIAALAALTGAYLGGRVAERNGIRLDLTARAAVAMVAGLGATAVAPLSMHPARTAQVEGSIDAVLTVGLTAALGAVVGAFGAVAVLSNLAIHWSVATVASIGWILALISVAPSLGPLDPLPFVRLAVLDLPGLSAGTTRMLALIGIPVLMLLVGAAVAGLARWLEMPLATVVLGGVGGPALLAVAYVLAGPGDAREQAAPYWGSIIGLAAGILGAVAVAVLPTPGAAAAEPSTEERAEPGDEATQAVGVTAATAPLAAASTAASASTGTAAATATGAATTTSATTAAGWPADDDDEATAPLPSTARTGRGPDEPASRTSAPDPYWPEPVGPDAAPTPDRPRRGRAKRGRAKPADQTTGTARDATAGNDTAGEVTAELGRPAASDQPPTGRRPWLPRFGRGEKAAKPRADKPPPAAKPNVSERDEDYVNWVSGLGGGSPASRRTTSRETDTDTSNG